MTTEEMLKKEANKAVLQLVAGESGKVTVVESGDGDPYKTLTVGLDQTFLDSLHNISQPVRSPFPDLRQYDSENQLIISHLTPVLSQI